MSSFFDSLLFKPVDPRPYAILRIVIGLVSFLSFLTFRKDLMFFFSDQGFYPVEMMSELQSKVYPISLFYFSGSPAWTYSVFVLALIVSALYAAGVKARWMGPLLWLCLASFVHRNIFVVDGSFILLLQIMIPLMLVDTGAVWSWDSRRERESVPKIYSWIGFVLRFQLGLIYFTSGFYKLMGADWVQGNAVKFVLANPSWRRFDFDGLLQYSWFNGSLTIFGTLTPWWELLFPLLVLPRFTRWFALGFGLFLHGSQWVTINTAYFVPILFSIYLLYLPRDFVDRIRGRLWPIEDAEH